MTGKDVLYGVAAVVAGIVAYKVFKTASAVSDAGGRIVDGAVAGLKEIVTKDLNPASNENVIYRAANVLTGGDDKTTSLGSRIYDWLNPAYDPNAKIAPVQTTVRATPLEDFRRSEIISQNEEKAQAEKTEAIMVDRRNSFRLSEIRQEPLRAYQTDYEIWSAPSISQSTGA